MDINLLQRLREALEDEYKSRASYRKVIDLFGPVRPFVNIVEAENRHVGALIGLFHRYGLPVPEDHWPARVETPASLQEACRMAAAEEEDNVAMYDRLIAASPEADVRRVLENVQTASRDRHLPAFRRCLHQQG